LSILFDHSGIIIGYKSLIYASSVAHWKSRLYHWFMTLLLKMKTTTLGG